MAGTRVKASHSAALSAIDLSTTPRTLLSVFSLSSFGLAVLDRRLHFVGVNRALAAMNGLPERAHPGKKISDVVGTVASRIAPVIERVFETGHPVKGVTLSAKLPARKEMGHWVEDYLPLADHTGKVSSVVALAVEVSQWLPEFGSLPQPHTLGQIDRPKLSSREVEIVSFLAQNKSNKEVSSILGISVKTVEAHRARILLKLQLDSLVGLVHYAIRNRLVKP
jgi:DNA-binding CsgD family transcriptional regulator